MNDKKNNFIVVNYNGVLQELGNKALKRSIEYKVDEQKIKIVLISLRGMIYENNPNDLIDLVKSLNELGKKLTLSINFIDYEMDVFKELKRITKKSKIRLFKNVNSAKLFIDPKSFKQEMRVLVYDKDESNSLKLSKELAKYGYTVIRAKDLNEFQTRMNDKDDHDVVITHSALNMSYSRPSSSKNGLALSKNLIVNLPVFMDTAVDTLISFTGLKAEKSSHNVKRFDANLEKNVICSVMSFKGDLEGFFTLVFPTDIAVVTMEALLEESVSEEDKEVLKDGVGEFCNIITGSIKTAFLKKEIKMTFDLPKTYGSLEETNGLIGDNNGIWIDMRLAGKPFYMFITK